MAKSAMQAKAKLDAGEGNREFLNAKLISAQFFCEHMVVRTQACFASIQAGSESIMALPEDAF